MNKLTQSRQGIANLIGAWRLRTASVVFFAILSTPIYGAPTTYSVGGTLTGFGGYFLVLQNNGSNDQALAYNGQFALKARFAPGDSYNVTLKGNPINPSQTCTVTNGQGTVGTANVKNIAVNCVTNTYTIGGRVTGLEGSGLVLQNNSADKLALQPNGQGGLSKFSFGTPVASGAPYSVTVASQPINPRQNCNVSGGNGIVAAANVIDVLVSCITTPPPAAVLSISYGIKQLRFSWEPVGNAAYYRLMQDSDGVSGFTQVGGTIAPMARILRTAVDISVYRHNFSNAIFRLDACNSGGCTPSNQVSSLGGVLNTIGYFKASNTEAGDFFGSSVAVSDDGNTVAVGASRKKSSAVDISGNPVSCPDVGAVFVFVRTGGAWSQQTYITADAQYSCSSFRSSAMLFGSSLALSGDGNTLAVGAPRDVTLANAGAIYVFIRNGGVWSQQARVIASNNVDDRFVCDLALSGDGNTLAVGASGDSSNATGIDGNQTNFSATGAGAAYIFNRTGNTWSQQAYIKASNTGAGDRFGSSIALNSDGNTLAVGAPREKSQATGVDGNQADNSVNDAGAVYVYTRSGATWSQQSYVKAFLWGASGIAPAGANAFGSSVALSGDGNTLAVGAPSEASSATGVNGNQFDTSAVHAGAAYVYVRAGTTWFAVDYIKASNTESDDQFGSLIKLSTDGNTLAVASIGESSNAIGINGNQADNSASLTGAVYVYSLVSGAFWVQQAYVKAPNTPANGFGPSVPIFSIALSGDGNTLAIGSTAESSNAVGINGNQTDTSSQNAGAVYLY